MHRVLTPLFAAVCGGFLLLVFAGFVVDGAIAQRWPWIASSGRRHAATEEKLVRLAIGAYFLLLWDKGAVVLWERGDAILTPELMAALRGWTPCSLPLPCRWRDAAPASLAILAVVCLRGASPLPRLPAVVERAGVVRASAVSAFYLTSLIMFFAMYYGLHWAEYG